MRLDSVQIGVSDPEAACEAYALVLGVEPAARAGARRFQLERGAVELEPGEDGLRAIRFVVDAGESVAAPADLHGVEVRLDPPDAGRWPVTPNAAVEAIDHVVVRTPDADRAIALWRDRPGLRLALDRVFAGRGLRLVFFRSGGITLEYASGHPAPVERDAPDRLYGVSYRVRDLGAHRERLAAAGLDLSPIRPGIRPGTSVATLRSGTAGVPTLLLQVDDEGSAA